MFSFYLLIICCLEALEEVDKQAREAGSDSGGQGRCPHEPSKVLPLLNRDIILETCRGFEKCLPSRRTNALITPGLLPLCTQEFSMLWASQGDGEQSEIEHNQNLEYGLDGA